MPTLHTIILGICAHSAAGLIAADGPPACFVPENDLVCFEGPEPAVSNAICMFRAGPLAKFSPHSPLRENTTCASLGYTQPEGVQDTCWPALRKHFKPDAHVHSTLVQLRAQSLQMVNEYADDHELDHEFAMKWTTCFGGCAGGNAPGYRWWGADRSYKDECKTVGVESRDRLAQRQGISIGSFRTDNGAICWQGELEYMRAALARTRATPYLHAFRNATVEERSCGELGYDVVRDPRDDCWPEASKNMRSATEGKDMSEFVWGPYGLQGSAKWYEWYYRLEPNSAVDWITCDACEVGGPNRDRGMAFTMHGAKYTDRYAGDKCKEISLKNARAGLREIPPLPKGPLKKP